MKTLAELRIEVEMGKTIYPSSHEDVEVFQLEGRYIFSCLEPSLGGIERENPATSTQVVAFRENTPATTLLFDESDVYSTFDDLLTDWPVLAAKPIWSVKRGHLRIKQ